MLRPCRRLISVKNGSAGSYGSPVRIRRPERRISRSVQKSGVRGAASDEGGCNATDVERLCRRRRHPPAVHLRRRRRICAARLERCPAGGAGFALLCDDPEAAWHVASLADLRHSRRPHQACRDADRRTLSCQSTISVGRLRQTLPAAAPRTAIIISGWRFRSSLALRGRPARMSSGKRASTSLPRPLAQSH